MARTINKCDLAPPKEVVLGARSVLGAIDLDPYGTKDINRIVMAARYYDRDSETEDFDDVIRKDWKVPGEKRVFVAPPIGAGATRRLMNKTLREYRRGAVSQAVFWISHNESIIRCPWIWDHPICIPFRRLRPVWWCDELETFRTVDPSDWSAIAYLPPTESSDEYYAKLSRFHAVFSAMGRIVVNERSGEGDWEESYRAVTKKPYDYRG